MKFGSINFRTSNEDKIFFPDDGITKGEIINYYKDIAGLMVPQLKERPISMLRYPDGINGEVFFQKQASGYFPGWIKKVRLKKEGGSVKHVVCNNAATLVYLANQACLTPHIWLSRTDKINYPDRMIFDLDPSDEDFEKVKKSAGHLLKFLSEQLKLHVFLMTTGSRGIHLIMPLIRDKNFDEVRAFSQAAAKRIIIKYPELMTMEVRKEKRGKKVFIDTARNAYAQTAVAPFAVRALNGAPVAAPLSHDELFSKDLNPRQFNIKNIFEKLRSTPDPWENIGRKKNSLVKAEKLLGKLL
ncbi:MAG TPA: non-homologous end-joining DNA ligase [Ignavibacteriaceae bacterium]|nr:non-homologous end-joining DNA ligase [Ignavibacteriaceae bacterium]